MSRFGASKFRNAIPAVPPQTEWYRSALPSGASSSNLQTSTFSSEVKANHLHIVTLASNGDASWRGYSTAAADGVAADAGASPGTGSGKLGSGMIGDWDVSQVGGGQVVVGCADGSITSYTLSHGKATVSSQTPPSQAPINTIACHPSTPGLILAASASNLAIWDLTTPSPSAPSISFSLAEPKGIWSAAWSPDGRQIAAIGKSGTLYLFTPRESTEPTASRSLPLQPLKPAKVSWVGQDIIVTSTSRTRNREYHLFSGSADKKLATVFTATLGTSTMPLLSVIDQERKIIYLASRGDMALRQVELGGTTEYQETLHPLPSLLSAQGLALAHPSTLDVMQAQIAAVLLPVTDKDGEALMPLGIKVPRRQLIDYHADLFPDVAGVVPEQSAADWLQGGDRAPLPLSLDPSRRAELDKQFDACRSGSVSGGNGTTIASPASPPESTSAGADTNKPDEQQRPAAEPEVKQSSTKSSEPPSQPTPASSRKTDTASRAPEEAVAKPDVPQSPSTTVMTGPRKVAPDITSNASTPAAAASTGSAPKSSTGSGASGNELDATPPPTAILPPPTAKPAPIPSSAPSSRPVPASSTIKTPYNTTYSRKFLSAKAPLNPAYDSLPPISTLHPDSLLLHVSEHLLFFPVQGPGGRLGVHPISKKGRMATGGEGYLTAGSEIVCYTVDPFEGKGGSTRVAVAGEDGAVRVWMVDKEGVQDAGPEPSSTIKESGIDKIVHMAFHPTALDLLVILSNDAGTANLRFFDLGNNSSSQSLCVSLPCQGAFSFAFNALGTKVAVSAKEGTIYTFDPRQAASDGSKIITGRAHDSPRSFQLAWIDDSTFASVGFDRGSQRKVNLYTLTSSGVQKVTSVLIDVSPSVLFLKYDADTHILYVWGKGERVISAYEVHDDKATERLYKLPGFTTSTGEAQLGVAFLDKRKVDVKKVEVMKALRLTGRLIEEVSFSIPRNKPEYFQDDVFVDTLDTSSPSLTSQDWLAGKDAAERRISLRPDGMKLLSEAPKVITASKAKFVPAKDVMTEQQKKQQEMDALFAKAKMGDSSDEDDEPKRSGIDPPDDDW